MHSVKDNWLSATRDDALGQPLNRSELGSRRSLPSHDILFAIAITS